MQPKSWKRAGSTPSGSIRSPCPTGSSGSSWPPRRPGQAGERVVSAGDHAHARRGRRSRKAFSPNGDGLADRIGVRFELTAAAEVRLPHPEGRQVDRDTVRRPLETGPRTLEWDGAKRIGRLLDGDYEAVLEATDAIGTTRVALPFASDTRQPKIRILTCSPLKLWVSEPARHDPLRNAQPRARRAHGRRDARPERAATRPGAPSRGRRRQQEHPRLQALAPPASTLRRCNRPCAARVQSPESSGPTRRCTTRS